MVKITRIGKTNKDFAKTAVDVAIFTVKEEKLHTLLIQIKQKPFTGRWAFPGGLVQIDESLDEAAKRELKEKTGMNNVFLEQLYSFGELKRDPSSRVISVVYFALVPPEGWKLETTAKYLAINWFPIKKLPTLAYDHNLIVKFALERLRAKLGYTNIVWSILPEYFTLSELQKAYEIILGREMDKRNFRKKIVGSGLLGKTKKLALGAHRPAVLYAFKSRKLVNIELL